MLCGHDLPRSKRAHEGSALVDVMNKQRLRPIKTILATTTTFVTTVEDVTTVEENATTVEEETLLLLKKASPLLKKRSFRALGGESSTVSYAIITLYRELLQSTKICVGCTQHLLKRKLAGLPCRIKSV